MLWSLDAKSWLVKVLKGDEIKLKLTWKEVIKNLNSLGINADLVKDRAHWRTNSSIGGI